VTYSKRTIARSLAIVRAELADAVRGRWLVGGILGESHRPLWLGRNEDKRRRRAARRRPAC